MPFLLSTSEFDIVATPEERSFLPFELACGKGAVEEQGEPRLRQRASEVVTPESPFLTLQIVPASCTVSRKRFLQRSSRENPTSNLMMGISHNR